MGANTDPIYSKLSDVQGSAMMVTAASVVYDISGTIGTDIYKVWTADTTNGGFVQRLRFKYAGNTTTTSVVCVAKVWLSSVTSGTPTIGTQAWLLDEIALPATGTLAVGTALPSYDLPLNFAVPAGWCILVKITASQPANFGWLCTAIAGKY